MKKFILTIVLASLCLFFKANAQSQHNNIKPLTIGDTIPEAIWNMPLQVVNHPQGKKTITLNDYRGKLIILDFWATWCGTCISRFPHVDSLNKVYEKQVQFVLVNSSNRDSDKQKVQAFTSRYIANHPTLSMPMVFQQVAFNDYFPCRVLPHYVWVGTDGRIEAITEWTLVNKKNIETLIAGLPLNLPVKGW